MTCPAPGPRPACGAATWAGLKWLGVRGIEGSVSSCSFQRRIIVRCMAASTDIDVGSLTVRELLRLSAGIITELNSRGVVRSRNAPSGDLAEFLVAKAYQGALAGPSVKSWDVQAGDHKLQVKCRLVVPDSRRHESFSPFRSWEFDACVFMTLDCYSYDVVRAVEVPTATVKTLARETPWVKGHRVSISQIAGPVLGQCRLA
jgi:hypothetical protein